MKVLVLLSTLSLALPSDAADLFGMTPRGNDGVVHVVAIDKTTGQATPKFSFSAGPHYPFELTYYAPGNQFVTFGYYSTQPTTELGIGLIDPVAKTFVMVPIKGLPAGFTNLGGFAYDPSTGRLLLGIPSTINGTREENSRQNRIMELDIQGNVLQISSAFGTGLQNLYSLGYDAKERRLLGFDWSARTGDRVFELHGVFSSNTAVTVGSPPRETTLSDTAIDPETGDIYVLGDGLLRISPTLDNFIPVGAASYAGSMVNGIAFAPEASSGFDFRIRSIVRDLATKVLTFTWNSDPGRSYGIEFSTDLSNWTRIAGDITGEMETTSFSDDSALRTTGDRGCYRVVSP